jgi:prevent-host-death family protein
MVRRFIAIVAEADGRLIMAKLLAIFMAMSKQANVGELKNSLSEYLHQVEKGEEILICKRNVPFAKIVPLPPAKKTNRSQAGSLAGTVEILGPVTGPCIPEEDWLMLR